MIQKMSTIIPEAATTATIRLQPAIRPSAKDPGRTQVYPFQRKTTPNHKDWTAAAWERGKDRSTEEHKQQKTHNKKMRAGRKHQSAENNTGKHAKHDREKTSRGAPRSTMKRGIAAPLSANGCQHAKSRHWFVKYCYDLGYYYRVRPPVMMLCDRGQIIVVYLLPSSKWDQLLLLCTNLLSCRAKK